jgi:hypothetical protein
MMEAVRTSETSVDNNFTRQYIPEDNSEHHWAIILETRQYNALTDDKTDIAGKLHEMRRLGVYGWE